MQLVNKPSFLLSPLTDLRGVGDIICKKFERLKVRTLQDLIFHLPIRYQDKTRLTPICALKTHQEALVEGEIVEVTLVTHRKPYLLVTLHDKTGMLSVYFFHIKGRQHPFQVGKRLRCFGELRFLNRKRVLMHPEYTIFNATENPMLDDSFSPVYPTTAGLTQRMIRKLMTQALEHLCPLLEKEELPHALWKWVDLPEAQSLPESLRFIHCPPPHANRHQLENYAHPAQKRIAFEELLAYHLLVKQQGNALKAHPAHVLQAKNTWCTDFISQLPFSLTRAQARVIKEIMQDLKRPTAMVRLLQGDVGSGKTVVAAISALHTIASGHQAALMAPTALLAEQHYREFAGWFEPFNIKIAFLHSALKSREKKALYESIASGESAFIIGTHALIQEAVQFKNLGLIVIDEQHRFGVEQRLALRNKGDEKIPHQLMMTATPIPRSLAMTTYADLDSSIIDELPPHRKPITTVLVSATHRDNVIARIRAAAEQGKQIYWVCTLIEESEDIKAETVTNTAEQLTKALPHCKIALIHSRVSAEEKESTMRAFQQGEIQLLVATTVIEVGVNVPNASLMIVENAERLGLAQLHQLRGRVGRGTQESFCVLLYSSSLSPMARARLQMMRETQDGFKIAEADLRLRGPGEWIGARQSGDMAFFVADLTRDHALLAAVLKGAEFLFAHHPEWIPRLLERWLAHKMAYKVV